MYMECTWNGIEFVFNNQTVLILLLLVETVCGVDLLSFNKIFAVHLNPINSLVDGHAHEPIVLCSNVSQTLHSICRVLIRAAK